MSPPKRATGKYQLSSLINLGTLQQLHRDEEQNASPFPIQKLPAEIQVQIWKYAASELEERIVEVLYKRRSPRFVSPTIVPWFLHLCSASRQAALQKYQPLNFGTYFTGTYVDWENDIIFFNFVHDNPEGGFYGKLAKVDARDLLANCKKVAMSYGALNRYIQMCAAFEDWNPTQGGTQDYPFMEFTKLQQVTEVLVCPSGEGDLSFDRLTLRGDLIAPYVEHSWRFFNTLLLHEVRAGRQISEGIAVADRGDKKRLKGKAKALKWGGGI